MSRIDPLKYRGRLRATWREQPGRYTAIAILAILTAMRDRMAELRASIGVGAWPLDHSSLARTLRGWDKEFRSLSARVENYRDEVPPCWGSSPDCWSGDEPGQSMVGYLDKWVIGPVVEGRTPESDPLIGLSWSPRPDAITAAMLWNQLSEVEELKEQLKDTSSHIGEWLLAAEQELAASAPGEEPTIADRVRAQLQTLNEAVDEGWSALKIAAVIGIAGFIGSLWLKR